MRRIEPPDGRHRKTNPLTHSNEWQDTRQLEARAEQAGGGAEPAASVGGRAKTPANRDFAHTEPQRRDDLDSRWWSEATDGQCSEEAAQFAASQPAPLSIV